MGGDFAVGSGTLSSTTSRRVQVIAVGTLAVLALRGGRAGATRADPSAFLLPCLAHQLASMTRLGMVLHGLPKHSSGPVVVPMPSPPNRFRPQQ